MTKVVFEIIIIISCVNFLLISVNLTIYKMYRRIKTVELAFHLYGKKDV